LCLVAGAFLSACSGATPVSAGASGEPLRFIVIGDMGTGGAGQKAVAEQAAVWAHRNRADFLLSLGDNFYSSGVEGVDDPLWQRNWEQIYAAPELAIPYYASLGNHDHRGNVQAQVDYSGVNPRWRMPARYYDFERELPGGARVHFIVLDTTPLHRQQSESAKQLAWLETTLAKPADWRIVAGHHPVYSHGPHNSDPALIAQLVPLFERHGVDIYFAGHDHVLELVGPAAGVHYVVSGGGAGPEKAYPLTPGDDMRFGFTGGGFVGVVLDTRELALEFFDASGVQRKQFVIRR
jgi:acid phosphatase